MQPNSNYSFTNFVAFFEIADTAIPRQRLIPPKLAVLRSRHFVRVLFHISLFVFHSLHFEKSTTCATSQVCSTLNFIDTIGALIAPKIIITAVVCCVHVDFTPTVLISYSLFLFVVVIFTFFRSHQFCLFFPVINCGASAINLKLQKITMRRMRPVFRFS